MGFHKFTAASMEQLKCNFRTFRLSNLTLASIFHHTGNPPLTMLIQFEIFGKHRFAISDVDLPPTFLEVRREQGQSAPGYKEVALAMLEKKLPSSSTLGNWMTNGASFTAKLSMRQTRWVQSK